MQLSDSAIKRYKTSIDGLTLSQAQAKLSTSVLNDEQKKQVLISAGLIKANESVTATEIKQAITENILTTEKQQEVLATFEQEIAEGKLSLKRLQAIALEDTEAGAIARIILAKKGENAQNLKNIASGKALTAVLKEQLLALATNPMTWVVAGLAGVVTVAYQCSRAIEEVETKAQELNETFSTSKTEIEDYKTQIDDLHKIINDSGSSIEDVTTARQNLMTIQDQLIEKFGDEKDTIDLITDAINGQTDALNNLTKAQWQAAKNEFNESGFWNNTANKIDGYSNNIDRMLGEYEGYTVSIDMSEYGGTLFTEGREEFEKMLQDKFGAIQQGISQTFTLSGDVSEVREKLLDIQEILKENSAYKPKDTFSDYLGGLERSADDVIEKYENFYKQYVLYEEIFTNNTFTDSYKKINDAYSEYQDAFATGDEESIKKAQNNFANILTQATEGVSDESVVDFFNDMYPDLQEEVGTWKFETNFTANTDGLKDDVSVHLSGLDGLYSYDLKNFNYDTATEEQKASYDSLISVARLYGLTIDQLIDKLVLMGLVQDEEYQRLVDQFGKENIAKIAPEDLTYAYQIKNIGELSFEELQAEIQRLKDEASNPDKITDSFASIFNSSDFSEQKQSLIDLAKAGELTNKALSSDDYSDFIDKLGEIGISAEEAKTEILSLLDATEKLSGASKSISGLENAYNEFKEKGYVLAETVESIPDVFRELETYDFDVFENIIGNPKANNDEIQDAFNDIVTAYISEMAVLSDVSEAEAQRFISNLEEMGVTNADTVVNSVLALNDSMKATAKEAESTAQEINEFLVNVKGKAASATNDLTNCTWSEIQALIEEGNKFGFTTNKIEEFAMKKIWANRNSINTSDDIAQLLAVAKTAGFAATSISAYENAVKLQKQGYGGGDAWVQSMQASAWKEVLKEIEASFNFTPTVSYKAPTTNSSSSSSSSSKEAEKTAKEIDWIEKLLERIQSRIAKLEKTASSTYKSWAERNKALLKQLSEVNTEINAQQKAYDTYMAKANSVGLSEHYKQLVQNGGYSIEDISDDTLKEKISAYEEWYNKAMDCSDAIDDLKNNILELTTTQFENVFNEYEDSLSGYKHQVEMLETYIDQTEAKGYVVSGNYYKQLIETEKLNIKILQDEYAKLKDSLQLSVDTGKIVAYSDAWYDMVDNIRNVQKSIEDANTSLIDYQTTLRELEWESFDRFMDKISSIKNESDFLIELMSDKDMFNEDGITDEGQATLGLHAINYNVYLSKAEEYAKKLKDINEEIANDPNNQTLLERRQELLELQQEAILASKDEQQAMKDLVSDGYDVFLESLQKIIDKQKELLNSQKD